MLRLEESKCLVTRLLLSRLCLPTVWLLQKSGHTYQTHLTMEIPWWTAPMPSQSLTLLSPVTSLTNWRKSKRRRRRRERVQKTMSSRSDQSCSPCSRRLDKPSHLAEIMDQPEVSACLRRIPRKERGHRRNSWHRANLAMVRISLTTYRARGSVFEILH